jgi:hypothetical protein
MCSSLYKEDAVGRWDSFRIRQTDPICQQWLILHKVDNNDQMRCAAQPTGRFRLQVVRRQKSHPAHVDGTGGDNEGAAAK